MQISFEGVSVYIGMPVYGPVPPETTFALASTMQILGARNIHSEIDMNRCGVVHWNRDLVLDGFLNSDKQKLFWIDSDMVWKTDAFFRLLALSTLRDVVCAAYMAKKEDVIEFQVQGEGTEQTADELGLFEIWGTGLGFTIIDRKVAEAVARDKPYRIHQGRNLRGVFRTDICEMNGEDYARGEDIAFFSDIRDLGHKIWLDPSIELGHVGTKVWRGRAIDHLKQIEE